MSLRDAPRSSEFSGGQGREAGRRYGRRGYGGLLVGFVALTVSLSGCSGGDQDTAASVKSSAAASASAHISASPSTSASPSATPSVSPSATPSKKPVVKETVSNYASWNVQKAVADARKHRVTSVSYTDASELKRTVVHTSNWKVCSQTPSAGSYSTATKLTFKIVGSGESCTHPPRASSGSTSSSGGSSSSGGAGTGSGGSTSTGGSSTKAQLCSIRSNAGNCYHAGQFCRKADVGATTTDAAGRKIACGFESGSNRWHY